jgi:PAS domain S-box-containing protein
LLLNPILEEKLPYLTLFGGIALAVWLSRWKPAALAALLGFAAAHYFLVERDTVVTVDAFFAAELAGYALSAGAIISFGEAMHRARERAEREVRSRHEAEESERRQKEQFRVTLSSIGDAVITTDTVGRIATLNPIAEALTGWSGEEALGKPLDSVFRIVNEETGEPVENPVAKVLQLGTVIGLGNHTALLSKDGSSVPIDDSAAPIREQDGLLHGVVLVFRDVSSQRAAQRAGARLASIVESSGDAIFTKDLDGVIQSWNRSAERLFGYSPDEIIGKPITLLLPPELAHQETEILARLRAGQPLERLETVRVAKNGRRIPVLISVSPLKDGDGRVIGASKIIHDMTEVVAAREVLRKSEERFRVMADSAPVLIWMSGPDKRFTWFNKQWLDFVGRPMEKELGDGWAENVHPDDYNRCLETYVRSFEARAPFSMTFRLRRHDGEYRFLLDNGVPRHGSEGEFLGYIGSCLDITERQRAEAALQEADRRKEEFLAVLSHELRNPLAPIRMAVGMLQRIAPPDPKLQELRDTIERQTVQLTRLLDDLLDVSRIASGKIVIGKERVSLGLAITSAVEAVRPLIDLQGQELQVNAPAEPIYIQGDVARLSQIIANLLNNAAKYTEKGSRIELTVAREAGEAVIRVRDPGIGISPDQIPRIFEMFAQVDPTLDRGQGGLGVGLALTKTLVELHGGRIEAKSAGLGKGSEFIVRLPALHAPPAPRPERRREAGAASSVGRRILVADDNEDSARMFATALRMLGHEVRMTHDGKATLEAADSFVPEMAILDIGMPKMNGYDVARELRARFGDRIALVAITGWGKEEDKRRALEAGFNHHLTKPVALDAVERLLAGALPPAKTSPEAPGAA